MTEETTASLEIDRLRRRHRDFYLELAEEAKGHILWHGFWVDSTHQREWLDVLDQEHDNLRTAIRWSLDQGHAEAALRFGVALGGFWSMRRYHDEGRRALDTALELDPDADPDLIATARTVGGLLAMEHGDLEDARSHLGRALEIARQRGRRSEGDRLPRRARLARELRGTRASGSRAC